MRTAGMYRLIAAVFVTIALAGCGGDHASAPPDGPTQVGSLGVTIQWPDRPESESALIPLASNSIKVVMQGANPDIERVLVVSRPTTQSVLDSVPVGDYTVDITAHPQADATGVPQALATTPATINANQTTDLPVTLGSTIDRIEITPPEPAFWVGADQLLSATARDASDSIVLVHSFDWTVLSGSEKLSLSEPKVYSGVSANAHGDAVGDATVQARDPETGQTATADVIVKGPREKWRFSLGAQQRYQCPAIGPDGTVYIGSDAGGLHAINPDGTLKWFFPTRGGAFVRRSAAVDAEGTIYFGAYDNYFYAVNPDGTKAWDFDTGDLVTGPPALGNDGTIFVMSDTGFFYALNSDGSEKWHFDTDGNDRLGPTLTGDGSTVYMGGKTGEVFALDARTGTEVWPAPYQAAGYVLNDAAIDSDGTLYFGGLHDHLTALNPDGTQKWAYHIGFDTYSSPAIGPDGTIFIGSHNGYLHAVNPNGTQKWTFGPVIAILSYPTVAQDGSVYFGSYDGNLYAINPDGTERWHFTTGGRIHVGPAIAPDGTIYEASWDGYLYAIEVYGEPPQLAESPWPTFHHDNRRTGHAR